MRPEPTWREVAGFFAMGVGMFMAMLDVHIVASSLADIKAGLRAGRDEISWVQTSYLIAEVVMIPLSGVLARILSTRVLFTLSALGFTAMSAACASADSIETMIVFRALQGFCGGAMIPLVFATAFTLFPGKRQHAVSAAMAMIVTLAPTLGPSLGGFITDQASWHWLFLVNVLPGCLVALTVWSLIRVDQGDPALLKRFDGLGLILMAVSLGTALYVLEEGPSRGWFDERNITLLSFVYMLTGLLFCWRMVVSTEPIVDLGVFANRGFLLGAFINSLLGVGLWGAVFLLPLFLSWVRGFNSLQIGVVMVVTGCFMFVSGPVAGFLAGKLGRGTMLAIGLGSLSVGVYSNSFLTAESSFFALATPQAFRGISIMFILIPANALALGELPVEKLKNASGLYQLVHSLGGALSVALINGLLIRRIAEHESSLGTQLNLARPIVETRMEELASAFTGLADGGQGAMALRTLTELVRREALVLAFNDAFAVLAGAVGVALLALPLVIMKEMKVTLYR